MEEVVEELVEDVAEDMVKEDVVVEEVAEVEEEFLYYPTLTWSIHPTTSS